MRGWQPIQLLVLWLFVGGASPAAQADSSVYLPPLRPRVVHFSPADYGGANQNWDLAQGDDGAIYAANSAGVLRFDGARWRQYPLPGRPVVRSVAFREGRVYAGGYGEFGYFYGFGGFDPPTYVSLSEQLPADERHEEIWNIEVLADGTVVFQSFARVYAFTNDTLVRADAPGIVLFGRARGRELLVPVRGRGLLPWSPRAGLGAPVPGSEQLGERTVSSFVELADGSYLIGTEEDCFRVVGGGARVEGGLPKQVNRMRVLRDSTLALGTLNDGLYLIGPEVHLSLDDGLENNTVLALLEDRAGNLWLGLDQGLALVVRREPLRYSTTPTARLGTVYATHATTDRFYLGTNQGLFVSERGGDGRFLPVAGAAGQVWSIDTFAGRLLVGHNEGTLQIENGRVRRLRGGAGVWGSVAIPGRPGELLQHTYTGLVHRSLEEGGGAAATSVSGLLAPLRSLVPLGTGGWLAAHASIGVYHLQPNADYTGYRFIDTLTGPVLSKPFVECFGDTVLVETPDGVYHYTAAGELHPLDQFRGVALPPQTFCLAGMDERREWFLGQPDRLTLFRGNQLRTELPVRPATDYPRVLPLDANRYVLPLNDGFAVLDPARTLPEAAPPLQLHVRQTERDSRQFRAALPVFDRSVRYRYRLLGETNSEWSDWTEHPEWTLRGLWEGPYRFLVETDWSDERAFVGFTVVPPWYRHPLAYLTYGLVVLGAVGLAYRLHRRRLHVQKRQLVVVRERQLQRERMAARNRELEENVEAKNRELANTTLNLARKNEMLLRLREELDRGRPQKVRHLIDRHLDPSADWNIFENHFNAVHEAYLNRLRQRHPDLTSGEFQLAAYLRMELSSKEIAPLLHISVRGVENKRYRLRKKLGLGEGENLCGYLSEV